MFGKLTLKDIPYHDPIIMFTLFGIFLVGITIFFYITFLKKWSYIWNEWISSLDHKKIGVMYIILAFVMLIRGFADAVMMRTQQALVSVGKIGFLPPHHYDQIFTAHGVIMIFFVAMPLIIGFMNVVIPLQIGARDLAFPFLNSVSFWLTFAGAVLTNISLGIGEYARTGWLAYPPLSEIHYSPGVGVDYWIWSLQISGVGTTLTAINFLVTILKMRAPGMDMFKMPVFVWTALCSNVLMLSAFPVLTITLFMLFLDRFFNFHFFTNEMGGNAMMYINLIWIWGHPEVYILILPAFGIFSEVVSTFSRKSLFGYVSLIWATLSITVLSFLVWLHHFFTMGSGADVNSFFGIATMVIAIPTGVKIFNWLFTMYKGRIKFHSSMLWAIGFLVTFSVGGMSGVLLSIPSVDFLLHNSLFLVAHFHNVIIGGVVFGCFAGWNYWFPKIFGFKLSEKWGKIAFWFWIIGFSFAFIPLYFLGMMGMTRRLSQNIDFGFHHLLLVSMLGVLLIGCGIICQIIQLIVSIKNREKNIDKTGDPWNGRTLEWFVPSPPFLYNFIIIPNVKTIDDFWNKKNKKKSFFSKKIVFKDIIVPKNSVFGFFIGISAIFFGFSIVWHIFWLFLLSTFFILFFWFYRIFSKDVYDVIPKCVLKKEFNKFYKKNTRSREKYDEKK